MLTSEQTMDKALIQGVLQLKPADRLRLLEIVHDSLDRPDAEIDEAWHEEAARRWATISAGKDTCRPAGEVIGERP